MLFIAWWYFNHFYYMSLWWEFGATANTSTNLNKATTTKNARERKTNKHNSKSALISSPIHYYHIWNTNYVCINMYIAYVNSDIMGCVTKKQLTHVFYIQFIIIDKGRKKRANNAVDWNKLHFWPHWIIINIYSLFYSSYSYHITA